MAQAIKCPMCGELATLDMEATTLHIYIEQWWHNWMEFDCSACHKPQRQFIDVDDSVALVNLGYENQVHGEVQQVIRQWYAIEYHKATGCDLPPLNESDEKQVRFFAHLLSGVSTLADLQHLAGWKVQ